MAGEKKPLYDGRYLSWFLLAVMILWLVLEFGFGISLWAGK
jgi:hypothetical protein